MDPSGRPRVTVSYAQSLDGRIATRTGDSRWISGPGTLDLAQELRRDSAAILVGVGTVLRDDPLLTCRLPGCRSPVRVVLDSHLRLPEESRIAATAHEVETIVFTLAPGGRKAGRLAERGIAVVALGSGAGGGGGAGATTGVPLLPMLAYLGGRGLESLLVEGGSAVITAFLRASLVDRLVLVIAPLVIGEGVSAVADLGVAALSAAPRFRPVRLSSRGDDIVWELAHGEA